MVEQPPISVGGVPLYEIVFIVIVLLVVALPAIATYILMARLASAWWKSRYLTTRIFLVALLDTLVFVGLGWVLNQTTTPSPYSHVGIAHLAGLLAGLLILLTAILGFVALSRWFVGLGSER
jgi:hypothetical protein